MPDVTPSPATDENPTVATATRAPPAPAEPPEQTAARLHLPTLSLLAVVVGVVTGFGAVGFRDLIGLVHNAVFLGRYAWAYDSSLFTPFNPWGPYVILVPVAGGIVVTFLVSTFAPEAKGHGVPEVMDAIYYKQGLIRPVVAVVKSLASAVAIGTGAAVGREGPIIQIGSALGSTLGQVIRMQAGQRITLVAAGAGAGIAATFNTPIGGVLFATELMLPEISVNTFLPVALATGTATFIGRLFLGSQPAFNVPANLAPIPNDLSALITFLLYAVLGALAGVAAALFIRGLNWLEDGFDLIPWRYPRHMFGMALVGSGMYGFWLTSGHYYIDGVGYDAIQSILQGQITVPLFLLILFGSKLLATSVSLGSGSSGGIFSPSLFMGAALGAAFASGVQAVYPGAPVSPPAFAMVGMGAMVGGGTGAAMTAVTMIFEMTLDYNIVLPMILAVALALGVRRMLSVENIYTMKLARRGHPIPKALHANMFLVRSAGEIMDRDVLVLEETTPFSTFLKLAAVEGGLRYVVVTRDGAVTGGLRVNTDLRRTLGVAAGDVLLGDLMNPRFIIVRETEVAFDVITSMWNRKATMAIVVSNEGGTERVLGVITKEHVADTVARSVQIYPG
jgi:CIC family chloride channel protein